MTTGEFHKLQEKYNKPRNPKQQKKYQEYEEKIKEIMKKPPNDRVRTSIGINELIDNYMMGSRGYFYDPDERKWCLYSMDPIDRSNDISFLVYSDKKDTEEEAFQYLYESLERKVKCYERDLEREKNDRMTRKEFLEWFGQDNRESRLAEKGPYQILWNREPKKAKYAVGYYYEVTTDYIRANFGDSWVAYIVMDGKYRMKMSYKHETRAIYMMRYWIQLIIAGDFDE